MRGRGLIEALIKRLGYIPVRAGQRDVAFDGYDTSRLHAPDLELLSDEELRRLNDLLPWSSFVVDARGRRQGAPFSAEKRSTPEHLPDPRIVELNQRVPLAGKRVLELGCFEGNHTSALCSFGAEVIGVDARVENVVKTLVRCALLGHHPRVITIDLEEPLPEDADLHCDVLHHVGVLYHLLDPVAHLHAVAPLAREAFMLDTHVATDSAELATYHSMGRDWPYHRLSEAGRAAPFAGTRDHAKWLRESDLVAVLQELGFANVDVTERRDERNGLRILLYATRA